MKMLIMMAGLLALLLVAGCGGDSETTETKAQTETPADNPAGEVQVATHDCDGGCGMKDVPMDHLTEKDGKFYCAGCIKKVEGEDHSGHDHN